MTLDQLTQRLENIARNGVTEVNDLDISAAELHKILEASHSMLLSEIYRAPCDHKGTRWTRGEKNFCGICLREVVDGN